MQDSFKQYTSPLVQRYASKEMSHLFSEHNRISLWRRLWLELAKAQKELGLPITQEQIEELAQNTENIDFVKAQQYEAQLRHDVMAHIHTLGDQCPLARPIIHLGATSCYVTDNAELILIQQALRLLQTKLIRLLKQLKDFAQQYAHTACLGYTHFQVAQPTTVGKRACLWLQDFFLDVQEIEHRLDHLQFLGVKGTTGTQASFLSLFEGDHEKVDALDLRVAKAMGFAKVLLISGQTYTRKQDVQILDTLGSFAASAHKFATDLRLLCHLHEVEEALGNKQVGSSAMPYKRNPVRSERICALARFTLSLGDNARYTLATQWLERSLDDSANRRLALSESFLASDALLNLLLSVSENLVVQERVIARNLAQELPFFATETLLMEAVKRGGDRQVLHEVIREHSFATAQEIKEQGKANDLLEKLDQEELFPLCLQEMKDLLQKNSFVGRSPEQVENFIKSFIEPLLDKSSSLDFSLQAPQV